MEDTQYIYLLIVTTIALLLRFYRLGRWSFWVDEVYTLSHALNIAQNGWKGIDSCHPLYYLSIAPLLYRFGVNEWWARSTSALVGTLSIPILTIMLQPMIGFEAALLFGFLLAISPWHVYWSQNARFYTFTFLFQLLALFNLHEWVESYQILPMVFFFVSYAISVLAHETSALSLIVASCYLSSCYVVAPHTLSLPMLMLGLGVVLLAAIYTLLVFLFVGGGYRSRKKTIKSHWESHYSQRRSDPVRLLLGIGKFVGTTTVCVALIGMAFVVTELQHFDLLVLAITLIPLGTVVIGSLFAYATTRYTFLSLAGFLLLATRITSWSASLSIWAGIAIAGMLTIAAVDELVLYYFTQNGNRERWREVIQAVTPRISLTDSVLTTSPLLVTHYLKRPTRWLPEFTCQMLEDLKGVHWFIVNDSFDHLPEQVRSWINQHTTLVQSDDVRYHMKTWHVVVRRYESSAHQK